MPTKPTKIRMSSIPIKALIWGKSCLKKKRIGNDLVVVHPAVKEEKKKKPQRGKISQIQSNQIKEWKILSLVQQKKQIIKDF